MCSSISYSRALVEITGQIGTSQVARMDARKQSDRAVLASHAEESVVCSIDMDEHGLESGLIQLTIKAVEITELQRAKVRQKSTKKPAHSSQLESTRLAAHLPGLAERMEYQTTE